MDALEEMSLEELWELFPIILSPHDTCWKEWAADEMSDLQARLKDRDTVIHHIGSEKSLNMTGTVIPMRNLNLSNFIRLEQNQKFHSLAYPERYKLSSGAELKSFRIPNKLNPFAYITTLFNGKQFDTFTYLGNDLLKHYENGEVTEEEVVNQLFSPWEQIDQSQHPLLAQMLQTASGGLATPQVGTGSGGSYDQSSWDGREHDPSRRKR